MSTDIGALQLTTDRATWEPGYVLAWFVGQDERASSTEFKPSQQFFDRIWHCLVAVCRVH